MSSKSGMFKSGDKSKPVPLRDVQVKAQIVDTLAEIFIQQTYFNSEDSPIEAVFSFPLDEMSVVTSFEAIVDGKVIQGKVKEKKQAEIVYKEAMARGDGAFLMKESEKEDKVFTINVGNLPPQKEAKIIITYITELQYEEQGKNNSAVKFILPTTITPKYDGSPSADWKDTKKSAENTIPRQEEDMTTLPYTFSMTVDVLMPSVITSVDSPSHELIENGTSQSNKKSLALAQSDSILGRDFVLLIQLEDKKMDTVWMEDIGMDLSFHFLLTCFIFITLF